MNSEAIARAVAETAADAGVKAATVLANPDEMADATVRAIRDRARDCAVLIVLLGRATVDADRAMLLAAIGPLAIELAPNTRLALVDAAAEADDADVLAAARYLVTAGSTTGQILRVG